MEIDRRSLSCCAGLRCGVRWWGSGLLEVGLEELEDALVFVGPGGGVDEAVVFDGVTGEFPVVLTELDEALGEADAVLIVNVDVDHAVADQERGLEILRVIDGA